MSREERIERLYEAIGLDADECINRGEIEAINAGIGVIEELIFVEIDNEHVSVALDDSIEAVNEVLFGAVYNLEIEERGFNLTVVDYDKVGMAVHTWFSPFFDIHFDGDGIEWDEIGEVSWKVIDSSLYRWRMIDTKGD